MTTGQISPFTILSFTTGITGKEFTFFLTDLSDRQLRADRPGQLAEGLNAYSMDETGVQPGDYFVTAITAATIAVTEEINTR